MNKYTGTDTTGTTWERISKQAAFKRILQGEKVGALPSKICVSSFWCIPNEWDLKSLDLHSYPWEEEKPDKKICFERLCNHYKYYNCNHETGQTIAFYKKVV